MTWTGANEYFGGENTQYGQHQIILEDGALQPDTFVNHDPTVADLNLTLSQGEVLIDAPFKAADADYDLLSFIIVDGPDHGSSSRRRGSTAISTRFTRATIGTSLHYHRDFLSGNLFDYTPDAGFIGTDSFTVYATDGQGNSNVATITITVTPPAQSITLTDAKNIVSYAGYDHAMLVAALGGDDRISGTPFNDTLDGGAGHDQLFGGAGADHIIGGAGTDWLKGGDGNDEISGGAGTDGIRGDAGDDLLDGGAGSDDVQGGAGDDILNGGAGRDRLAGGYGPGRLRVRRSSDRRTTTASPTSMPSTTCSGWAARCSPGCSPGPLFGAVFVVGKHAVDDSDHIIYDKASGDLLFDADGVGGAAASSSRR